MLTKICLNCKKEFEKPKCNSLAYWNRRKFCSKKCAYAVRKGIRPNPKYEFKVGNKNQLGKKNFLGKHHTVEMRVGMSKNRMGAKNPYWKGGTTIFKANKTIEWKLWREGVFKKDKYVCVRCEETSHKLIPHHIQGFAHYPELRFVTDNGITFCQECHRLFHGIYGYGNNTREQLEEFLKLPPLL